MRKIILLTFSLFVVLISGCSQSTDYSVLNEDEINKISEVANYVDKLQSEDNEYKGYKVFDTSDGDKVVVISSGNANKSLKVFEVAKSSLDTAVTVTEVEYGREHSSPSLVIRIDEIVGAFYVFERVRYDSTDN